MAQRRSQRPVFSNIAADARGALEAAKSKTAAGGSATRPPVLDKDQRKARRDKAKKTVERVKKIFGSSSGA